MNSPEITQLLRKAGNGEQAAYQQLMPRIYEELQSMAYHHLSREYDKHTYSKTELVHEAYLKLCQYDRMEWQDRSHFYAIASKCMRQILIDYARKKLADKRGGDNEQITYLDHMVRQKEEASDLIDLDAALKKLEAVDERLAKIVELRYFGEMSIENVAEVLNLSPKTIQRDWKKARGWLYKELKTQSL